MLSCINISQLIQSTLSTIGLLFLNVMYSNGEHTVRVMAAHTAEVMFVLLFFFCSYRKLRIYEQSVKKPASFLKCNFHL